MSQPPLDAPGGAPDAPGDPDPGLPAPPAPAPLLVAAVLALVEGLGLVGYGVAEVATLDAGRAVMGTTVAVFFLAFGGLLAVCAWGLWRVRPWTRGPVLLAQLIALGLAWNFRSGSTLPVALVLAVVGAAVLAGLLHPRSVEAIERAADRR